MYALVAYFDQSLETYFKTLWQALEDRYGITYGRGKQPHITLADFDDLDVAQWTEAVGDHFQGPRIPVTLNGIGTFLGTETLFLSPIVTHDLMALHRGYHEKHSYSPQDSLYLPKVWRPHVTVASRLGLSFDPVMTHLRRTPILKGYIEAISLIRIFEEGGLAAGHEVVWSEKLNE